MIISSFDACCVSDQREIIWMAEQRVESDDEELPRFQWLDVQQTLNFH